MKQEILHYNGAVLFCCEVSENDKNPLRTSVCTAVKVGANLRGANLEGANLEDAVVFDYDSVLAKLTGSRPIQFFGPIGSREDYLTLYRTDQGIYSKTGCFIGSLENLKNAIAVTHRDNPKHRDDYMKAIAFMVEFL